MEKEKENKTRKIDLWYLCLSDDETCPEGYDVYVFPDSGYVKNIRDIKERNAECIVIDRPWTTNDDFVVAQEYYTKVIHNCVSFMAQELNDYHNVQFSFESWYVFLGMWMEYFVPQLLDKYNRIKEVLKLEHKCECSLYDVSEANPPHDYSEFFMEICHSEDYNKYIYSEIINYLNNELIECIRSSDLKKKQVTKADISKKVQLRNGIYDSFFAFFHFVTRRKDKVLLHNTFVPNKLLTRICFENIGFITNYISLNDRAYCSDKYNIAKEWRKKPITVDFKTSDDFYYFVGSVIKKYIPASAVELYSKIECTTRKMFRYAFDVNAAVFSATGICSNEYLKCYLMILKNTRKAKLCVVQHGGDYGTDQTANNLVEARMSDIQYTWGWKEEYSFKCECIPMPAAKLIDWRANATSIGDYKNDILYVAYAFPKHLVMFHRDAILFDHNKNLEKHFFKSLGADVLSRMRVRLFPDDYGRNAAYDYSSVISPAILDDEKDYYVSVSKAGLCVFSFFSTAFLEAINQNKPCLVFREKGYVLDNAKKYIDELERVGVICTSWDDLRENTSLAASNINKWWNDVERRKAVELFRIHYAYRDASEESIWSEEIKRLAYKYD